MKTPLKTALVTLLAASLCPLVCAVPQTAVAAPAAPSQIALKTVVVKGVGVGRQVDFYQAKDLTKAGKGAAVTSFSTALDVIREKHADIYTTARYYDQASGKRSFVVLTAAPPNDVLKLLAALPSDTEVRYGAPVNSARMQALSAAMTQRFSSTLPAGKKTVVTRVDPESLSVVVDYSAAGAKTRAAGRAASGGDLATAAQWAARDVGRAGFPLPVRVGGGSAKVEKYTAVTGGRLLSAISDGVLQPACTAGFTAKRGGKLGVVTAAHCPNSLFYRRYSRSLAFTAVARSNTYDLQFNQVRSGFRAHSTFYVDEGDTRFVARVRTPVVGETICKTGITTGFTCDTVWADDVSLVECTDSGKCSTAIQGLQATEYNRADYGDSGGPFFFGLNAGGILVGAATDSSGAWHTLYTTIDNVKSQLSASILTGRMQSIVGIKLSATKIAKTKRAKVTTVVTVPDLGAPTGVLSVRYGNKTLKYTLAAKHKRKLTVTLPKLRPGTYKIRVSYKPRLAWVAAASSKTLTLKVR